MFALIIIVFIIRWIGLQALIFFIILIRIMLEVNKCVCTCACKYVIVATFAMDYVYFSTSWLDVYL